MIAAKLAQRRLVQFTQNLTEPLGLRIAGRKILPVNLAQRANERVSMFAADFAVLIAVAIVESWLAHVASTMPTADSIDPPRSNGNVLGIALFTV
jgi:hypothetical protein